MVQDAIYGPQSFAPPGRMPASHTTRGGAPRCQVPGCTADLTAEPKAYCLRKRICTRHMQAEVLQYPGNQWCRYCFQCAKVEPLSLFDGNKKSCRLALHKRRVRPLMAAAAASASCTPAVHAMATSVTAGSFMTPPLTPTHPSTANGGDHRSLQQQLLAEAHMAFAQQQQQQQMQATPECLHSQLASAANALTAACNMTEHVAAALAAAQPPHMAPDAMAAPVSGPIAGPQGLSAFSNFDCSAGHSGVQLQLQQQQLWLSAQQQQHQQATEMLATGSVMPSACHFVASRTPSSSSSCYTQLPLSPGNTSAAAAATPASAAAAATATHTMAAAAGPAVSSNTAATESEGSEGGPSTEVSLTDIDSGFDDGFDDFLDSLLQTDLAEAQHNDLPDLAQHSDLMSHSAKTVPAAAAFSNSISNSAGVPAGAVTASLTAPLPSSSSGGSIAASPAACFPPFFSPSQAGGAAASPAPQSALFSGCYGEATTEPSVPCSGGFSSYQQGVLPLPCPGSSSTAMEFGASGHMALPAATSAAAMAPVMAGFADLMGGGACGLGGLPVELLMQGSAAQKLQALNLMLQQVQSSVLALAHNMQVA